MQNNCVIYVRVSSEKQVDGYSLDSQEELCKQKAQQLNLNVLKVFREEGVSAKDTNREELQKMLSLCRDKNQNIKAIIVYSQSRLNRNTVDYLTIRASMMNCGISIISLTEPNGDKPADTMIGKILASMYQFQNEERAINVANSLKKRFMEGHITVKPPIGYLMVKVNGKSQAVKDPEKFLVIQNLWKSVRDERLSLSEAAHILNKSGINSNHDSRCKKFLPQSMSKIFSNKFYMGILVSEKYGEAVGRHEPMIDEETFLTVQKAIKSRKPINNERHIKFRLDFPLRGLLRCADCSKKLTSAWAHGHTTKVPYYFCASRKIHKITSYHKDTVEPKFIKLLKKLNLTEKRATWLCEILEEKYHEQLTSVNQNNDWINREIDKLKEIKFALSEKHLSGLYSDEEFLELKRSYDSQIEAKKQLLTDQVVKVADINEVLDFMRYYLTHLDTAWSEANLEGKMKIGGSIFPQGVIFERDSFRTPILGLGYQLNSVSMTTLSNRGDRFILVT